MKRKFEIIRVSGIATGVGLIEKLSDGFYSESICETLYDTGHDKKDAEQSEQWAKKICDALNAEYSFTKEELEARDRMIAAEAWDSGGSSVYDNIKPDGGCGFDSTQHLKDKETYLNSLISK